MKITPMPSTANTAPTPQGGPELLRSIKMTTNATPGSFDPSFDSPVAENANPPDNDDKLNQVNDETKPISPQFARLAKERRALQVKERELKAREEALAQNPQQGDSIQLARLKAEPLKVLLENGVTYDDLTQALLGNQANPDVIALKNELNELKQGVDKKFEDNASQQKQAALAEMKREATRLASNGEDYALTREMGRVPDVMTLIERTYDETGEILSVPEAMGLVEAELEKEAERIAKLQKIQSKFAPQQQPQPQPARQPVMRTLANSHTASAPMTAKQRAIAAFHGRLQQ